MCYHERKVVYNHASELKRLWLSIKFVWIANSAVSLSHCILMQLLYTPWTLRKYFCQEIGQNQYHCMEPNRTPPAWILGQVNAINFDTQVIKDSRIFVPFLRHQHTKYAHWYKAELLGAVSVDNSVRYCFQVTSIQDGSLISPAMPSVWYTCSVHSTFIVSAMLVVCKKLRRICTTQNYYSELTRICANQHDMIPTKYMSKHWLIWTMKQFCFWCFLK